MPIILNKTKNEYFVYENDKEQQNILKKLLRNRENDICQIQMSKLQIHSCHKQSNLNWMIKMRGHCVYRNCKYWSRNDDIKIIVKPCLLSYIENNPMYNKITYVGYDYDAMINGRPWREEFYFWVYHPAQLSKHVEWGLLDELLIK